MTPEELADRHPRLYHVTAPENVKLIRARGLLSTFGLLHLFEVDEAKRDEILSRRDKAMPIYHPKYGTVIINDNKPLHLKNLERCLIDLEPCEWLMMLNERVFFWADKIRADDYAKAYCKQGLPRTMLTFDTRKLALAYAERLELSPINSGSATRRPARRGRDTFTPLLRLPFAEWRRQRRPLIKSPDVIHEVVALGSLPDACSHLDKDCLLNGCSIE